MLNLTQNACYQTRGSFGANPYQSFNANPMMMAMALMTAAMMSTMTEMMGGNGLVPMSSAGFGGNAPGGSPLNAFLGGPSYGANGCNSGYDGGYNGGWANNGYNNGYNNGNSNSNSKGNLQNRGYTANGGQNSYNNGTCGTGKTNGVGKDLPEGVDNISYTKACEMVKNAGGQLNPDGKPTVLAIRGDNTTSRTYQDAFIVLKPDGTMEKFAANTRPTSAGQDKAMLKNGEYNVKPRWQDAKWQDAFIVGSSHDNNRVAVSRDKNGDGQYSDNELNSNNSSDTIRLHRGKSNGTTSSAGCLNVKDYDGFLDALGGRKTEFNLVLVTM